jgi:hypothetical protein
MSVTSTRDPLLIAKSAAVERYLKTAQPRPTFSASVASVRPEHNVVGVGLGSKLIEGRSTGTVCVRFYVERKIAKDAIPPTLLLPENINEVETDVIESGRFRALQLAVVAPRRARDPRARMRPAHPGCSVGFQFTGDQAGFVMAGTLGAIVKRQGEKKGEKTKEYLLSNNHVLANEGLLPVDSPIFQPGLLDDGNVSTDQIAKLSQFVPLAPATPNDVDCAVAEVLDSKLVRGSILGIGRLADGRPVEATEGMPVEKSGRTTGFTAGTIADTNADVIVGYETGNFTFQNQIIVVGDHGPFSQAGDSGSLIVATVPRRAVALLFAGSATHTIGNPISAVLSALNVVLVH